MASPLFTMDFYCIPAESNGKHYRLNSFTGSLAIKDCTNAKAYPKKMETALSQCASPFSLTSIPKADPKKYSCDPSMERTGVIALLKLAKISFWASYKLPSLVRPKYTDARQAIELFASHTSNLDRNELCLTRSLFAAAMSKKFKNYGVIFIGVFLPSRSMHSWVIEDGIQPDPLDSMWVNYRPVAALC